MFGNTVLVQQSSNLSAADISHDSVRALKVLDSWPLHKLTNHPDWITEVGSSDCQINEAFDNLSESGLIAGHSRVSMKLQIPVERSSLTSRLHKFVPFGH